MKNINKQTKVKGVSASNYAFKCPYCNSTNFSASPSGAIHCADLDCIAVYAFGNKAGVADWHCINEDEIADFIQYSLEMDGQNGSEQ